MFRCKVADTISIPFSSTSMFDRLTFLYILGQFEISIVDYDKRNNVFILTGTSENLDIFANYWAERSLLEFVL